MKRIAAAIIAITILLAASAIAKPAPKKAAKIDPPAQMLITSVDATANTITVQYGESAPATYTLDAFTQITVNGKTAKISELQQGMKVGVTANGAKIASRVEATSGSAAKPAVKATPKKK